MKTEIIAKGRISVCKNSPGGTRVPLLPIPIAFMNMPMITRRSGNFWRDLMTNRMGAFPWTHP